ncbi:MAG: hypothetical protein GDA36_02440 [Rhodobacteraceae bacterium]|nr:hypothetical protein [Paracoccaceae bacterium]
MLSPDDRNLNIWLGIVVLAVLLGIGPNWGHVCRALSDRSDIDEVDE